VFAFEGNVANVLGSRRFLKTTHLTKVVNRRIERAVDYATPSGVIALLREYAKKRDLPLFRMLEILGEERVNSISFTRDSPYFRFYAHANGGNRAAVSIDTEKGQYETTLDLSQLADDE
jgi:uncharacterized Fe-S cluster-containing radical SAM superfamily protein